MTFFWPSQIFRWFFLVKLFATTFFVSCVSFYRFFRFLLCIAWVFWVFLVLWVKVFVFVLVKGLRFVGFGLCGFWLVWVVGCVVIFGFWLGFWVV